MLDASDRLSMFPQFGSHRRLRSGAKRRGIFDNELRQQSRLKRNVAHVVGFLGMSKLTPGMLSNAAFRQQKVSVQWIEKMRIL
jgi:hypothetical protein